MISGTIHSARRRPKATVAAVAGLFVIVFALFSYSAESRFLSRQFQILSDAPTRRQSSESFLSTSLANHTGDWIGNSWLPPQGWRTFSAQELRQLYANTSMLWIGDSTARRAGSTFYAILNGTEEDPVVEALDSSSVIDVNKGGKVTEVCSDPRFVDQWKPPSICRQMPSSGDFLHVPVMCFNQLDQFFKSELSGNSTMLDHLDMMVVSLGIWEGVRPWDCREVDRDQWQILNDTIQALETLARTRDIKIIWRTSGFNMAADDSLKGNVLMSEMNDYIMARLDEFAAERKQADAPNNFFYVNWGGTMRSRSFGDNRIEGDMRAHYGLEARHALIQMVTNVLYERSDVLARDAIA